MGSMQAAVFAGMAESGEISIRMALEWHLQANHYPPVPLSMVPVCERAIAKAKAGKWNAKVRLPKGCTYRGSVYAPVDEVVRGHHLDTFI
jgi:hypothetical protein